MGMYTELIFGAELKKDTPKQVIDILYNLLDCEISAYKEIGLNRNPIRGGSTSFGVAKSVSELWKCEYLHSWHISTRANIKNYDSDIEKFLDWIKPWIDTGSGNNDMYAIVTYEDNTIPRIYYLTE